MTFLWRRGKANDRSKNKLSRLNSSRELNIPTHFLCPISLDLMKDPVTVSTGISYDRENIEKWIVAGNVTCPVTNQPLGNFDLTPNHSIRKMIQHWCVENKSYGIERVPTPRIPITSSQVQDIFSKLENATQCKNEKTCMQLVTKIKLLAKENQRNKKCIVENGAASSLSTCFEAFANYSMEKHVNLLKDLLSTLTEMCPLGEKGKSKLGSSTSLRCMAWFLKNNEDLLAKQNAILVLKELISLDQSYTNGLMEIQDVDESLFKMVIVPICPQTTKASLVVIYYMITYSSSRNDDHKNVVSNLLNMGLVSLVLETLVDAERSISEKALAVLDSICNFQEGKEKAYNHGLTIPLLVKKIIRVSVMASEFAISILWKLCCKGENNGNLVIVALELGAFEKLLVVLQVGCGERIKVKVTDLLKLMNLYKDRVRCFDSSTGFKYLKKSY